ncbi:ATP-binding domain-containing protein [Pseudomonas sp. Irchel 3E13]|uniref:ATP-binding domain-containing protein n=1 Tax=Pseudomonas sp. Irchel 3E13 TaxID=2008975 RepID=UPI0021147122|nr:ATP-binding domain-containing protein [Pseudomonas sp. Irchel 3E13]
MSKSDKAGKTGSYVYVKDWHLQGCPGLSNYDQVFLDEAQDASDVMLSCLAYAQRATYVGDAGQQIFQFRGSQDAMLKVPGREYPLTLSFRFGPTIADLLNRILQFKSSPPSIKIRGLAAKPSRVGPISPRDEHTRIFRTNTALIRDAITLKDLGESFSIVGDTNDLRDRVESVFALMRNAPREVKHPAFSFLRTHDSLAEWASEHPGTDTAQVYQLARDYELRENDLVRILSGRGQTPKGRVTLTTCHKAKGREWANVIVREDFDQSLSIARRRSVSQFDDELNLLYVAASRSKSAVELQISELNI